MSDSYRVGAHVKWKWGDGWGEGQVRERFTEKTTRTLKGSDVTRDASAEEPAYLIEQDDGDQVLKSHTELQAAE